jgi:PadR family transcriptional regulator, regulatory protein PadR
MYGYQIIKELHEKSNGYFQFKEGTLYPALHRLERNGLISSRWEKLFSGPERRYYHITGKGQEVLNEKRAVWRIFSEVVNSIMLPV